MDATTRQHSPDSLGSLPTLSEDSIDKLSNPTDQSTTTLTTTEDQRMSSIPKWHGRINLPAPYVWPTIWVDFLSNMPVAIVWLFFIFDYESNFKPRVWSGLFEPWKHTDANSNYIAQMRSSYVNQILFAFWTLQVIATVAVVRFHLTVAHHPKFYVGKTNKISIVCHIVGGTMADLGGYLGFLLNSFTLIKIASLAGLFLHVPTAFWQSRNLHGRREVMQPAYFFFDFVLIFKYAEVWFTNGSFVSVISMGFSVNSFALVRSYFTLQMMIGMDYTMSYDRAIILTGITNLPIMIGPTACIQFVSVILMWNVLLEILLPNQRQLLQVNRTVFDIFPDKFNGQKVDFAKTVEEFRRMYPDDDNRVIVSKAAFKIIAGDDDLIQMSEIEELFDSWGLPNYKDVAAQVFIDGDDNGDNVIDYEEFRTHLWFIWERLYQVGEAEIAEDGRMTVTSVEYSLNKKSQ